MRQFISSHMPDSKGRIALDKKEFRYLSRVLRLQGGVSLDVRLSDGSFVSMLFCADKTKPCLVLNGADRVFAGHNAGQNVLCGMQKQGTEFWLFQFLAKPQKMDLIVRQAAECGVSCIVPVKGEFSPPSQERTERWRRIVREARQQSGSAVATCIKSPLCAKKAAALWEQKAADLEYSSFNSAALMLCEKDEGQNGLFSHIGTAAEKSPSRPLACLALVVGSEGGISSSEKILFERSGFMPIHFKTNILRTETAALYGLAAVQIAVTEYGEWKLNE